MERRHVCDFQSIKSRLWFEVTSQGTYGNSTCCPAPHWGLYTLSQNIRANSQTNGLERGWKRRVRLRRNARKVRLIRYTKPILRKKKQLFCSLTFLYRNIKRSKLSSIEKWTFEFNFYLLSKSLIHLWWFFKSRVLLLLPLVLCLLKLFAT